MSELSPRPRRTTKTYKSLRTLREDSAKSVRRPISVVSADTPTSIPPKKNPLFPQDLSSRRKFLIHFIIGGVVLLLVVGVFSWYLLGKSGVRSLSQSPFTLFTARVFGMSIAEMNGEEISYVDYQDQLRATKMFFDTDTTENLTKLSDQEMRDYVLARLLINQLTKQVAREYDVVLENSELDMFVQTQLIQNFGNREAAEENVQNRYGWSVDQFAQNIIRPAELERKLVRTYLDSIGYPVPKDVLRDRAQGVLDRIKGGEDFKLLAREFGMDATAENGGNIGWFVRGMLESAVEDIVFSLEKGELASELIETENGFYIVRTDDRKNGQDPVSGREREELSAHMIFFRIDKDDARPFAEYMNNRLLGSKVEVEKGIVNPLVNFFKENSKKD